ncbi:MAG: HNH endonuclease signature motif containing protein, partial [Actinomycetes bacterium]
IGVVVALSTLLGLDDEPGELAGHGPITAEVARRIAAEGTWRRLLTDPVTGQLVAMGSERYEPPQEMRDAVIARDKTCRGPGCRMPADRGDLDHTIEWPGGPTRPDNLCALCRTHHRIKTLTDTRVESDGTGGLWITLPSGRRYHRPAEPLLDHPGLIARPAPRAEPPDDPDPPTDDELDEPPF